MDVANNDSFSSDAFLLPAACMVPWISYTISRSERFISRTANQMSAEYSCWIQSRVCVSGTDTHNRSPSPLTKAALDSQLSNASVLILPEICCLIRSQIFILLSQSAQFLHMFSTGCGKAIIQVLVLFEEPSRLAIRRAVLLD